MNHDSHIDEYQRNLCVLTEYLWVMLHAQHTSRASCIPTNPALIFD